MKMFMRNWSILIGQIAGVEVRVHLTFLLLLIFVWLPGAAGEHSAARALALVAIIFASVVLHELGHGLASMGTRTPVRCVMLLPIGGVSLMDDTASADLNWAREIRIALAGPIVSFLVAGVAIAFGPVLFPHQSLLPPSIHTAHLGHSLVWVNVALGLLNLLPAYPLDGGRVVRAFFLRSYDALRATRRAVSVGQFCSTMFLFAGMAGAIYGQAWSYGVMLVGFFLFVGVQLEDRYAVFHAVLENVRMEDVMLTEFATLSPADTLEDALVKVIHSLQDDFPVIRGSELVGIISRFRILDILRVDGNGYIQPVMSNVSEIAHRGDSLASVFGKITQAGIRLIPVVDGERLVGIVTLQNLMHSMALLAESKKLQRAQVEE
jgi:Zn-dependent protease